MTNALFKPALSTDQLRAIQERNRGNDDVMTLLWEIKRPRSTVLRAEQLQKMIGNILGSEMVGQVLALLRTDLDGEPVIQEQRQEQRRLMADDK